jgi:hypothetical protein
MVYNEIMKKLVGLFLMSSIAVIADQNSGTVEKSWMDETHQYFSQKVYNFSHHLDDKLSGYACMIDSDCVSLDDEKTQSEEGESAVNDWFSSFFRDEIFDDVYTKSYVIVRGTVEYDHRTDDVSFSGRVKASLALPKTEDRLHFYIEDEDNDDLGSRDFGKDTRSNIGLRYFQENDRLIKSSYSLGLHSLDDPYARATFWLPYQIGAWRNRISQKFQYSVDEKFEEETRFYFDRILDDDSFVRFLAARWTIEEIEGMQYFGNIVYNKITSFNKGYQIGVSALGHTEPENEITQYAVYGVYKENIYRKWLFYEIEPRVEWDREYDFDPNYKLLVSLEIFFGDL